MLILAVGEIIDTLQKMNDNLYTVIRVVEKMMVKEKTESVATQSTYTPKSYTDRAAISMKQGSSTWTCKNCGTQNSSTASFCKDCGKYK